MTNINTLLDKADRVYHQLMGHRPQLESLLSKVNEAAPEKTQVSHKRGLNSTHLVQYQLMIIRSLNNKKKTSFLLIHHSMVIVEIRLPQIQFRRYECLKAFGSSRATVFHGLFLYLFQRTAKDMTLGQYSRNSVLVDFPKLYLMMYLFSLHCPQDDSGAGAGLGTSSANVNRYIQQLAQEYSGDCKTSFDELSKIIQVR